MKKGQKGKQPVSESTYPIPEGLEWVLDIVEDVHLPHLGLPVDWEKTQDQHSKIAFNPETGEKIHIQRGKIKKVTQPKKFPLGFIDATKGHHVMPGTEQPAAVRYERYEELLNRNFVKNPVGDILVPCLAHGDYVKVESLQADHIQAKENIIKRQRALVDRLNEDPRFAEFLMKQKGMGKFFVKAQGKYYGTLLFYEAYFNDIDNIWLICSACNLKKSNQETWSWFKDQKLYGEEFIKYLSKIEDETILQKVKDKQGLAEVAIAWFWERHATHMSNAKSLYDDIYKPLQILSLDVDRIIGSGSVKRAERKQTSLQFKMDAASTIANMKGTALPKGKDESPHDSSDEDEYLRDPATGQSSTVSPNTYKIATGRVAKSLEKKLPIKINKEIKELHDEREKNQEKASSSVII